MRFWYNDLFGIEKIAKIDLDTLIIAFHNVSYVGIINIIIFL